MIMRFFSLPWPALLAVLVVFMLLAPQSVDALRIPAGQSLGHSSPASDLHAPYANPQQLLQISQASFFPSDHLSATPSSGNALSNEALVSLVQQQASQQLFDARAAQGLSLSGTDVVRYVESGASNALVHTDALGVQHVTLRQAKHGQVCLFV